MPEINIPRWHKSAMTNRNNPFPVPEAKINKRTSSLFVVFDRNTRLYEVDQFVDKFRKETDKKDELVIDLNLSKTGYRIFLAKHRKKEFYH